MEKNIEHKKILKKLQSRINEKTITYALENCSPAKNLQQNLKINSPRKSDRTLPLVKAGLKSDEKSRWTKTRGTLPLAKSGQKWDRSPARQADVRRALDPNNSKRAARRPVSDL